jgi:Carboxypeptidase regulatory-like domain/Subtilase family
MRTISKRPLLLSAAFLIITAAVFQTVSKVDATRSPKLEILLENGESILFTDDLGSFHRTSRTVSDTRAISFADSKTQVFTWQEDNQRDSRTSHYAISLDGTTVSTVQEASTEMLLRYAAFDPLVQVPKTPQKLGGGGERQTERGVYIVQFVTQPLEEYRKAIRDLGGKIFIYVPNNSYIVQIDDAAKRKIEELPFVRWVGVYEPVYKLEETLIDGLSRGQLKSARYNIMVLERGVEMKDHVAARVRSIGGKVESNNPEGFRLEATLSADQLLDVANENDVLFIDRWSAPESDMSVVRSTGGANFVETTIGFRGEGVRAEVLDAGLLFTHADFQTGPPPIAHGTSNVDSHGTATYGINFGRGTTNPAARGLLPEAQGIFADYDSMANRYTHTAQLKQDPYKAVYQSNSWGNSLTTAYTTVSAEMDDITFTNDFLILNSQSNNGNQMSRPQAWAKNVVSVGGIRHFNTADFSDDRWAGSGTPASIGPAADGRIKPDLAHFYDSIHTTTSTNNTAYTTGFGGTSAATPITAGHFGIFFQMWHNGIFGNPTSTSVFESRPHMTTAKAVMINTAIQWEMAGTDITRVRQGFGRVDVKNLYDLRGRIKIVNETDVLTNLQSKTYQVNVAAGTGTPLKITMVYADPMGNPAATRARINDLNLKVTAPNGNIYWGNNGLGVGGGMWSTSGGSPNIVDTVENVFVQNPASGTWTIEVIAAALVQDARFETPGVIDADYALVASGISAAPTAAMVTVGGRVLTADGRGIKGATISLTGGSGEVRQAVSGSSGYYSFADVPAGQTFVLTVTAKRYSFSQSTQVHTIHDETADIDFVANY